MNYIKPLLFLTIMFCVNKAYCQRISASFNESTDRGIIEVSGIKGRGPFTYLIGYDNIPKLDVLWGAIRDSTAIDSLDFFKGKVSANQFRYTDLPKARYFVAVFDNRGEKVFSGEKIVGPPIRIYSGKSVLEEKETENLIVDEDAEEASIVFFAFLPELENGGFEFRVSNLKGQVTIGLNNDKHPEAATSDDFEYCINVDRDGNFVILRDGITKYSGTTTIEDQFLVYKLDDEVKFYKNGVLLTSISFGAGDFRLEALLEERDSKLEKPLLKDNFKNPFSPKVKIDQPLCPGIEGVLLLDFQPFTDEDIYVSTSYTITNIHTGWSTSGITSGGLVTVNLPVGVYSLTYSFNQILGPPSAPIMTSVFGGIAELTVGYTVNWSNLVNTTIVASTLNTISPTTSSALGTCNSFNTSSANATHWVEFEWGGANINLPPYTISPNSYVQVGLENSTSNKLCQVRIWNPGYGLISGFADVDDGSMSLINFIAYNTDEIRIEFTTDVAGVTDNFTVKHAANNYSYTVSNPVSNSLHIEAEEIGKVAIINTRTSFCNDYTFSYADVTKKLDGGYYEAKHGFVKFIFNEEYNDLDQNLSYEIFDASNQMVFSQNNLSKAVAFGDNRYMLNFSCNGSNYLSNGIYVLKVINEKGEAWYLRFKIVNNNC